MHPTQTQYFVSPLWMIAVAIGLSLVVLVTVAAVIVLASSRRRDEER